MCLVVLPGSWVRPVSQIIDVLGSKLDGYQCGQAKKCSASWIKTGRVEPCVNVLRLAQTAINVLAVLGGFTEKGVFEYFQRHRAADKKCFFA